MPAQAISLNLTAFSFSDHTPQTIDLVLAAIKGRMAKMMADHNIWWLVFFYD